MREHLTSEAFPSGTKGSQVQPTDTYRPPGQTHRHGHDGHDGHDGDDRDDDDIFGVTPLSADQRKAGQALHRLFQSLCGGQPGQYWPQALLDSAGGLSRPSFPVRNYGGRK